MTTLLWSLAFACLVPYVASSAQTAGKVREHGTYDNAAPREQTAKLVGFGKRAAWAQANTWEALPIFVAAALTCHVTGADGQAAGAIGVTWIVARLFYIVAYVMDVAPIRSALWLLSLLCSLGLFGLAATHS